MRSITYSWRSWISADALTTNYAVPSAHAAYIGTERENSWVVPLRGMYGHCDKEFDADTFRNVCHLHGQPSRNASTFKFRGVWCLNSISGVIIIWMRPTCRELILMPSSHFNSEVYDDVHHRTNACSCQVLVKFQFTLVKVWNNSYFFSYQWYAADSGTRSLGLVAKNNMAIWVECFVCRFIYSCLLLLLLPPSR